jgi:hypothetical protein
VPHGYGEVHFGLDIVQLKLHALELRTEVAHDFSAEVMDAYSPPESTPRRRKISPTRKISI